MSVLIRNARVGIIAIILGHTMNVAGVENIGEKTMDAKVIVTKPFVSICGMQVCAVKGTPDSEILSVCNSQNPTGIRYGWNEVVRTVKNESMFHGPNQQPITCADNPEREHLIILC